MNSNVAAVFDLSPAEKLQLVEDLWDDLASCTDDIPIQPWHMEELRKSELEVAQNPASLLTWEQVKKNARSRYGR